MNIPAISTSVKMYHLLSLFHKPVHVCPAVAQLSPPLSRPPSISDSMSSMTADQSIHVPETRETVQHDVHKVHQNYRRERGGGEREALERCHWRLLMCEEASEDDKQFERSIY